MWMSTVVLSLIAIIGEDDHRTSPCAFVVSPPGVAAQVLGSNEATRRASVMTQPDSPLAIVTADLSGMTVTAGSGSFERSGRHVLDVKNVSDNVITKARVTVMVGFGPGSGVGSGFKLQQPLAPGEQTRLEWKSGLGRGSEAGLHEASVVAMVEEVEVAGCLYRPSQSWPAYRR